MITKYITKKLIAYAFIALPLGGVGGGLLTSCNDDASADIFPDAYKKTLTLKQNGMFDVLMNTTQQTYTDSLLLLRGGSDPETNSTINVRVMSLEETATAWGLDVSDMAILPAETFSVDANIDMGAKESHKFLPVTFMPKALFSKMQEKADVTWILPLELSCSNATIHSEYSRVLLRCSVKQPSVRFTLEEDPVAEVTYKSLDFTIPAELAYSGSNAMDFTCEINIADKEEFVKHFNDSCRTKYTLLPEKAYTLTPLAFTPGSLKGTATLSVNRSGLVADRTYVLPVRCGSISVDGLLHEDLVRYIIVTNPKYCTTEIDRTDWKIVFCNCQDPWNGTYTALSMIDDNLTTEWGSNWGAAKPGDDDFDYDDAKYGKGFMGCTGRRDCPDMLTIIDLGAEYTIAGVGVYKISGNLGDNDMKSLEIYTAPSFTFKTVKDGGSFANYNTCDEGNDWTLCLTFEDIPKTEGAHWHNAVGEDKPSTGRYIKFRPTESYRGANLAQCGELYLKKLVSIDGEPVE